MDIRVSDPTLESRILPVLLEMTKLGDLSLVSILDYLNSLDVWAQLTPATVRESLKSGEFLAVILVRHGHDTLDIARIVRKPLSKASRLANLEISLQFMWRAGRLDPSGMLSAAELESASSKITTAPRLSKFLNLLIVRFCLPVARQYINGSLLKARNLVINSAHLSALVETFLLGADGGVCTSMSSSQLESMVQLFSDLVRVGLYLVSIGSVPIDVLVRALNSKSAEGSGFGELNRALLMALADIKRADDSSSTTSAVRPNSVDLDCRLTLLHAWNVLSSQAHEMRAGTHFSPSGSSLHLNLGIVCSTSRGVLEVRASPKLTESIAMHQLVSIRE